MFAGSSIIAVLILGAIAGWLAGQITRGGGFGIVANIVIGIVGALIGSVIFGALGLGAYGFWGQLVMATIGAVILVMVTGYFQRPARR